MKPVLRSREGTIKRLGAIWRSRPSPTVSDAGRPKARESLVIEETKSFAVFAAFCYLWIPSPELALLRISDRVAGGGHNVPERDVRRRFGRTLGNLFTLYRPLLDTLHFFDNSSDTPRLIFKDESGQSTISDAALYAELRRQFEP